MHVPTPKNLKDWLKKRPTVSWAAFSGFIAMILILIIVRNMSSMGIAEPVTELAPTASAAVFRHPLTGAPLEQEIPLPAVYAVMVENSADAWPQAGIEEAFLVIEAPAEGSIPRFVTFFGADQDVEKIGPVRSARPYYIDWASAFSPLYAHVGGSPAAITQLQTASVYNFDEMANQYEFWRSPNRYAPHNVYTSTELLQDGLSEDYPDALPDYEERLFKDDATPDMRPETAEDLVVDFGSPLYRVTWSYDAETNTLIRYQNTDRHGIEDGDIVSANNVIVIETSMIVLDAVGRLDVETIGEGDGVLVQDGVRTEITWQKDSPTTHLSFFDEDGKEMALNAGKTWIEVVESLDQVTTDASGN